MLSLPRPRAVLLALALGLGLSLSACAPSMKVMTFNVRYPSTTGDEAQRWTTRRPVMVELIRQAKPDIIGTQELFQLQGDDIVRALPGYRWFGRDRRGAHADEHMGIFYRTDRLRLVEQGDYWLSDTPDRPGSMAWGADLPRMVNWGVFEQTGGQHRRFVFLDTHFAHRDADEEARTRSARLIVERLPSIARGMPIVLVGDLNGLPASAAHRTLAAALTDAWDAAGRRDGPPETFHDFTGTADKRIDYILISGFTPQKVAVERHHRGTVYPSDHFPITATLRFDRADQGTTVVNR